MPVSSSSHSSVAQEHGTRSQKQTPFESNSLEFNKKWDSIAMFPHRDCNLILIIQARTYTNTLRTTY